MRSDSESLYAAESTKLLKHHEWYLNQSTTWRSLCTLSLVHLVILEASLQKLC
jgi:hypothetical protein